MHKSVTVKLRAKSIEHGAKTLPPSSNLQAPRSKLQAPSYAKWIKVSELNVGREIAAPEEINGRVWSDYDGQYRIRYPQIQAGLVLQLWQSLVFSFPGIDNYTTDKENNTQYYKSEAQNDMQFFKEVTGKSYSQDSFAEIGNIFSNKFSARFIEDYHNFWKKVYHAFNNLSTRFLERPVYADVAALPQPRAQSMEPGAKTLSPTSNLQAPSSKLQAPSYAKWIKVSELNVGREIAVPREINGRVFYRGDDIQNKLVLSTLQELLLQLQSFPLFFTSFWIDEYTDKYKKYTYNTNAYSPYKWEFLEKITGQSDHKNRLAKVCCGLGNEFYFSFLQYLHLKEVYHSLDNLSSRAYNVTDNRWDVVAYSKGY